MSTLRALSLLRFAVVVLVAFVGPTFASRAASPLVDARLTVALIQFNGQSEVAAPAASAKPGDLLEYAARYFNRGNAPAEALAPTMPIPVGTAYVPSDLSPKPTHASLDGVAYAPMPLQRLVKGPDGTTRTVDVPIREYRALRWTIGRLAVGSEVTVRARVRVADVTSLAAQ